MTELSAEAKAILEAGQAGLSPSAATKASVLQGVTANLPSALSAGPTAASAGSGLASLKVLSAIVLALGIGGGIWLARATDSSKTKSYSGSEPIIAKAKPKTAVLLAKEPIAGLQASAPTTAISGEMPNPTHLQPGESKSSATIENAKPTQAKPTQAKPTQAKPTQAKPTQAKPTQSESSSGQMQSRKQRMSPKSTLAEEQKLIASAQIAIRKKQFSAALIMLKTHSTTFPNGILTPERKAATAIALCDSGKGGKAGARRFLESYATSPLAARVRASCKLP